MTETRSKIASLRKQLIELDSKLNIYHRSPSNKFSDNASVDDIPEPVRKTKKKPSSTLSHKQKPSRSVSTKRPRLDQTTSFIGESEGSSIQEKKWTSPQARGSIEKKYVASKQKADKLEAELFNERQKNHELRQQIKECEKKLKLNEKTLGEVKKLKEDYEVLVKSFKYSEQIRQKQKDIIKQLTMQLEKAKSHSKS